jgi:hypothetical protein
MSPFELEPIETAARRLQKQGQRKGQSLFNALYELNPEMANALRYTDADPFYQDNRISDFYTELYLA